MFVFLGVARLTKNQTCKFNPMKSLFRTFFMVNMLVAWTALAAFGQTNVPTSAAPLERNAGEQQGVVKNNYNNQSPALIQFNEQTGAFSQRQVSGAKPNQDPTKRAALLMLAHEFETRNAAQEVVKQQRMARGNLVAREVTADVVSELKGFEPDGKPIYYVTSNLSGAATIFTDRVWPGGLAGLSLSGTGMVIGEWDERAIRVSHQEFSGRATVMDGDSVSSNHATHVAGTIIAAGVDPAAKGMAYAANLHGYNWSNDEPEMATAAAAGMLVSNHSYGLITGWAFGDWANTGTDEWYWFGSIGESEDRSYGRYSQQARDWDLVAQNAPNYTIVKAAGNDRGDGPSAGASHRAWDGSAWVVSTTTREVSGGADGFDCISGAGVGKNVLTIGAVQNINGGYVSPAQVIASSFHGWGPTDDGRIKPDIVAKGVGVYSATAASDNSYASYNGTSMASPTVTGSIALLQQHHMQAHNGAVMTAAMVKALVIQTADEAGAALGPDYSFGWGLMNTAKAAEVISNTNGGHAMVQDQLANGTTFTYTFTADGNSPIKATVSWTDLAAAVAPNVLNGTTKALVNDLDIRITRVSDNTTYQPWVLNPATPAASATTGDNDRDNVEQIFIAAPIAGDYVVSITHKGTLAAAQAFAMVLSGGTVGANNNPQVFWNNDFGNSSDWTTANGSGNADNWSIGTAGPTGFYAIPAILSPTAANGFGLFDSDLLCSGNQNAYLTVASPINVAGYQDVKLRFYQQYRKYFDSTMVEVSTNGQQWTSFLVNGSLANNDFSNGNPEFVEVDISSVADQQAQVWFRFRFWSTTATHTANGGCGYSWMVDDVSLQGTPVQTSMTNVTFQVNMINETVSPLGVRIAGSFQGWDPSSTLMMQDATDSNTYTYTTAIQAGTAVEYKFVNGNAWGSDENPIPAACNINGNRGLVVPAQDTVLGRVAFGSCSDASTLVFVPVTFNVDMSNEVIRPEGVHMAGNFQGWNPSASPMVPHPTEPGVYTYTTQIPEGTDVEYKFVNGNSWGVTDSLGNYTDYSETVPVACAGITGPNRYFTVPVGGINLPAFVFGSCNVAGASTAVLDVDFANGIPADWTQEGFSTIGGVLTPDSNVVFEYRGPNTTPSNAVGSRGAFNGVRGPIQSPTAANGFVVFDSDYLDNGGVAGAFGQGPAPASHKASLISPVMDLSNVMQPRLRFNQTYRRFSSLTGYSGATVLIFSRDGGLTWPDTIPLNLNVAQNAASPSNDVVDLMLNNVLGGESNARMAFLFYGDYYYWMIDDIKLEQAPAMDLSLSQPGVIAPNGVNYGFIPMDQQQGTTFSALVSNFGATAVNGAGVFVNVLNQGNVIWTEGNQLQGTLNSADQAQVDITNPPFFAGQPGTYDAQFNIFGNPNDADPASDFRNLTFNITDTVYAVDRASGNYSALGSPSFPNLGSQDGMQMATRYSVGANGLSVSSATVFMTTNSTPGTQIEFKLYNEVDLFSSLGSTNSYIITAQDIQNGFVTLSFPAGTFLAQGEYYLAVEFYTNVGTSVFNVLDDISVPQPPYASSIYLPANGLWYTNGNAFLIRLNSGPSVQPPVGVPVFVAAPQNNGSTTGIRGPNGSAAHAFMRGAAIVQAGEFANAGIDNGRTIRAFGMSFSRPPSEMVNGNIKVYLLPTADVTYTKGTAWTSIVNDMNVVYDGPLTLMPGTQNWTVELDQAFLYNGDNYYVAYDWSSTGPYAITPAAYFANSSIPSSGVSANSDTAAPQTLGGTAFRVEMLWGMQRFANDLEVVSLFAKGKNASFIGGDEQVSAIVKNNGYNFMMGNVNLMSSGANATFQNTFVALEPDSSMLVFFPPASLNNLGYNELMVSVDMDDNNGNNTQFWQQEITDSILAYNDTMPSVASVGFATGSGIMMVKHRINATTQLRALRVRIGSQQAITGNNLDAVVTDANGNFLATSNPITIDTTHLGQWVVFAFSSPVALNPGGEYYFGLRQPENLSLAYFPLAYQAESPTRPDAYFTAPYLGGIPSPVNVFRLMIEVHTDPVETVDVTFRVNMSKYPVSPQGVHLAGNFQGWVSNATPMTDMGNGVWERVVALPSGYPAEYKFINGDTWGYDETNWLSDCGVENGFGSYNRAFAVPTQDTVLPAFFMNSCGTNLNELSLADIQFVPDYLLYDFAGTGQPNRRSRYAGDTVTIQGRVAGSAGNSALSANFKNGYLQMEFPANFNGSIFPGWMGVNVRLLNVADTSLFVSGNNVSVTGVVSEFPATNAAHSETQLDVSSGGVSVLAGNSSPNVFMAEVWMFNDNLNGSLQQNPFGERMEGSYVRFENLTVTAVTEFSAGRFDLTLVDVNGLEIKTRDVSRVMRAPYFSNVDSNAALYVQVGDSVNIQGFISELTLAGVPQYRIAPWNVSDIEINPSTANCPTQIFAYSNTDICLDQSVQLEVSASGPVNFVEWFVNGNLIPSANGMISIFAVSEGEYEAVVYYQDGCVANTNSINVRVTMPHRAFVSVNGPLHHEMGQAINTTLEAVPQQLLRVVAPSEGVDEQIAYRAMVPANGWNNVPQGAAANFSGSLVIARDASFADSLLCGPAANATALAGNIAIIYRGACAISDKVMNVQNAGAIAVIVVNSNRNQLIPNFATNPANGDSVIIPVLVVSAEAGDLLQEAVAASATITVQTIFAPSTTAAYSYQWYKDNNPIAGANGTSYVVNTTGDYQLDVTTGGSCNWRSGYLPVSQSVFQPSPWVLQNLNQPDVNLTIRNVSPVSDQVAWALLGRAENVPFTALAYRTTDGGATWTALSIPNSNDLGTSHIHAVDANTAFVTLFGDSSRQGVYKTADGGLSWTRLNVHNNNGFPNFTYFWNANEGVTAGDPVNGVWEVYTTSNGGTSWTLSSMPIPAFDETGLTAEFSVTADGSLYMPTNQGQIYFTGNKGQSWNIISQPTLGQTRIAWGEQGLGVIYNLETATIWYTEDGGFTWDPMERPYGGLGGILGISFVPGVSGNQILVATGPNGSAYAEENVGWFNIDGIYHGPVSFISPTVGWSGGISGTNGQAGIWKWDSNVFGQAITDGSISGVVRYSNAAQTPLNNSTVGLYDIQMGNLVATEITDATGAYSFAGVPAGDYEIRVATNKGWGGVNATDALRVARHFTGLQPLMGMRQMAADVNRNSVINSTDALQIAQRFTGLLNNPNNLRIYFDALFGGNLATAGSVHMHSGASIDPSQSWQYVVGDWGNPASPGQMVSNGNGQFAMVMNPMTYYSQAPNGPIPSGSMIESIGMVFRSSGPCGGFGGDNTPCLEQKDGNNQDIFVYPTVNPPLSTYLGVKATRTQVNGFAAGDWLFESPIVNVQAGQNTVANVFGICVGDVDGSYNPSNARIAPLIALDNAGEPELLGGKLVRLPIRIEQGAQIGAMSLVMHYDKQQMQPVSLKLIDPARQAQALVNITDEQISLGWYDLAGWVVTNEEVIMELEALVYGDVTNLALSVEGGSEFADVDAQPIETTVLLMPGVKAPIQTSVGNVLSLSNYPNPFKSETNIAFNLPEAADVKIRITDARGRQVALLNVGELAAGAHDQYLDAAALEAGVYFCELHAAGKTRSEKAIIRLIVQ